MHRVQRLSQGQVVQVAVRDPCGQNLKTRPAVILTKTDELANAHTFVVACISTQFTEPLPLDHIRAPWSPNGRAKSGLTKPSVVKCRWLCEVRREDVHATLGHLPAPLLRDIMRVVTRNP